MTLQKALGQAIRDVLDKHAPHLRVEDFDGLVLRKLHRRPGQEYDFYEIRVYDRDQAVVARDRARSVGR